MATRGQGLPTVCEIIHNKPEMQIANTLRVTRDDHSRMAYNSA